MFLGWAGRGVRYSSKDGGEARVARRLGPPQRLAQLGSSMLFPPQTFIIINREIMCVLHSAVHNVGIPLAWGPGWEAKGVSLIRSPDTRKCPTFLLPLALVVLFNRFCQ